MVVNVNYISNISIVYKKELENKIRFYCENVYSIPIIINQFGDEKQGVSRIYNKDTEKAEDKKGTIFESFFFKLQSYDGDNVFYD